MTFLIILAENGTCRCLTRWWEIYFSIYLHDAHNIGLRVKHILQRVFILWRGLNLRGLLDQGGG